MWFGAQVSSAGGISKAIDRAESFGCDAVQVFPQSPRTWRATLHPPEEVARFRERREQAGIRSVLCHAPYLVNLASADPVVHERSVTALAGSLATATAIGAAGVVFHVGSHLGRGLEAGLSLAVPALRGLLELTSEDVWLVVENSAGAGGTIGRTAEELAALDEALERHPRLGFCLDSCHWHASGVDVTSPAALGSALRRFDTLVGLPRLRCVHVNDAAAPLGSNRDRHASLGAGVLGEGLGAFVAHPAFQGLPAILETPGPAGHGPDATEVRRLRELYARWVRAVR